jgi:uncharacterized protein (DUF1697 family)
VTRAPSRTTRYAAFLRAVSPMNAKMPELKRCFESAGFTGVATVLSSGNVVFDARPAPARTLERTAEQAMTEELGRTFLTIVRAQTSLAALLEDDPFRSFRLPEGAKRVVTFLRRPSPAAKELALPLEVGGARILCVRGAEVFTAYVPSPRGAVFMTLIEKTFGTAVTTRTWDTVKKVAAR